MEKDDKKQGKINEEKGRKERQEGRSPEVKKNSPLYEEEQRKARAREIRARQEGRCPKVCEGSPLFSEKEKAFLDLPPDKQDDLLNRQAQAVGSGKRDAGTGSARFMIQNLISEVAKEERRKVGRDKLKAKLEASVKKREQEASSFEAENIRLSDPGDPAKKKPEGLDNPSGVKKEVKQGKMSLSEKEEAALKDQFYLKEEPTVETEFDGDIEADLLVDESKFDQQTWQEKEKPKTTTAEWFIEDEPWGDEDLAEADEPEKDESKIPAKSESKPEPKSEPEPEPESKVKPEDKEKEFLAELEKESELGIDPQITSEIANIESGQSGQSRDDEGLSVVMFMVFAVELATGLTMLFSWLN